MVTKREVETEVDGGIWFSEEPVLGTGSSFR